MTEPIGGWNPCPPGELGRLAAWLTFRRRLRAAAWAGVVLLAVAGLAGAARLAYPVLWAGPSPDPAGCHTTPPEEPPPVCNHDEPPAGKK